MKKKEVKKGKSSNPDMAADKKLITKMMKEKGKMMKKKGK